MDAIAAKLGRAFHQRAPDESLDQDGWRLRVSPGGDATGEVELRMATVEDVTELHAKIHGATVVVNGNHVAVSILSDSLAAGTFRRRGGRP